MSFTHLQELPDVYSQWALVPIMCLINWLGTSFLSWFILHPQLTTCITLKTHLPSPSPYHVAATTLYSLHSIDCIYNQWLCCPFFQLPVHEHTIFFSVAKRILNLKLLEAHHVYMVVDHNNIYFCLLHIC